MARKRPLGAGANLIVRVHPGLQRPRSLDEGGYFAGIQLGVEAHA